MKKFLANKLTRLLPIVALVASAITSPLATAGAAIGFDPNGGSAYTYSDLWTMFTDTALATGFNTANPDVILNPFDPRASVGAYETELRAQARVAGFQLNGLPVFAPFLNAIGQAGGYEITKVLRIQELVVQQSGFGAPGGTAQFIHAASQFDMDTQVAGSQQLEIWLDRIGDNSHARPGNGAGTVRCYGPTSDINLRFGANTANINNCVPHDGILILGASLISATSSFATNAQAPFGVGTGAFDLEFLVNYVAAGYLDIATNSIFGDKLTGTINVPSQFTPARVWDGKATCKVGPVGAGCDMTNLLLKVDSSESFLMTVPEPGSLALVGLSLLGAGFVGRRRRD